MNTCSIEGCNKQVKTRGFCSIHHMRWWRYGEGIPAEPKHAPNGAGCIDSNGYVKVMIKGKSTYEHIVLAEKALGKPLPIGAVVHHTEERHNNIGYCKLVLCPDDEYHSLIHKRMKDLGYENT